jgi:hypothetical protein
LSEAYKKWDSREVSGGTLRGHPGARALRTWPPLPVRGLRGGFELSPCQPDSHEKGQVRRGLAWPLPEPPKGIEPLTYALRARKRSCCRMLWPPTKCSLSLIRARIAYLTPVHGAALSTGVRPPLGHPRGRRPSSWLRTPALLNVDRPQTGGPDGLLYRHGHRGLKSDGACRLRRRERASRLPPRQGPEELNWVGG